MLKFYNTLTKNIDTVYPLEPGTIRMYTCGPTVYRHAHIGNLRSYLMADWIRRLLEHQGLNVIHVKNITDVGHMRQELLERGDDKVIAAALQEGKTPQELAEFYTEAFFQDEIHLNILPTHHSPRATQHIPEILAMVTSLLEKGQAYEIAGNVYFAVAHFHQYGKLSGNIYAQSLREAVRGDADPLKRDPRDFALWKAAEPGRQMKWSSPWGEGFPGWHIECSAMATRYLGPHLDIHTGGVDNIFPHHEDELAQSEAVSGSPFVRHWIHGQHLLADGVKMAKASANDYSLADLMGRGYDALAFRYLCLTTHYRTRLNFTFAALRGAQSALSRLRHKVWEWSEEENDTSSECSDLDSWRGYFWKTVSYDLHLPKAITIVRALANSNLPSQDKLKAILEFDQLLGLSLIEVPQEYQLPDEIRILARDRETLRSKKAFGKADQKRKKMARYGYIAEDIETRTRVRPKTPLEKIEEKWRTFSNSTDIPSLLRETPTMEFTVIVVASDHFSDIQRCLISILKHVGGHSVELLIIDNGSTLANWLEEFSETHSSVKVIHLDHRLGEASARNIGFKQARGHVIINIDPSVEVTGNIFEPLSKQLKDNRIGIVGPWGLCSTDLREFFEPSSGEVDAIQSYCIAFLKQSLLDVGLMRETFRFYRNLDLDFSFQFKNRGYCLVSNPSLPMTRHEHRDWQELPVDEREKLSRKNFRRFLRRWDHRYDLLVKPDMHH